MKNKDIITENVGVNKTCVLCEVVDMDSDFYPALHEAQKIAIKNILPLAVVHTISKPAAEVPDELLRLKGQEDVLNNLGIPLMILVGDPIERLSAVVYHLNPKVVIHSNDYVENQSSKSLVKHPYVWPGKIITIDELLASGFMCDE